MPKFPINYANGLIYKIQHNTILDVLYVGSTCNFRQRKAQHKSWSVAGTRALYIKMREHGTWADYSMVLVKVFPCHSSLELCAEEDKTMRELKATLNCRGSIVDVKRRINNLKEYRASNKEAISAQQKEYRIEHKEAITAQRKTTYKCSCGTTLAVRNKARHQRSVYHINHAPVIT